MQPREKAWVSSVTWVWEVRALSFGFPLCISDFSSNNERVSFSQIEKQKGALSLGRGGVRRGERKKERTRKGGRGDEGGVIALCALQPGLSGPPPGGGSLPVRRRHGSGGKPASQLL